MANNLNQGVKTTMLVVLARRIRRSKNSARSNHGGLGCIAIQFSVKHITHTEIPPNSRS